MLRVLQYAAIVLQYVAIVLQYVSCLTPWCDCLTPCCVSYICCDCPKPWYEMSYAMLRSVSRHVVIVLPLVAFLLQHVARDRRKKVYSMICSGTTIHSPCPQERRETREITRLWWWKSAWVCWWSRSESTNYNLSSQRWIVYANIHLPGAKPCICWAATHFVSSKSMSEKVVSAKVSWEELSNLSHFLDNEYIHERQMIPSIWTVFYLLSGICSWVRIFLCDFHFLFHYFKGLFQFLEWLIKLACHKSFYRIIVLLVLLSQANTI